MTSRHLLLGALAGVCIAGIGCATIDASISQPGELTGQWARLGADTAWSDTVRLLADGTVQNQQRASARDSLHWGVLRSQFGVALCIGSPKAPQCNPYRLEGDTLIVGRLPHVAFLRRVH
jgi:hypothetical protein